MLWWSYLSNLSHAIFLTGEVTSIYSNIPVLVIKLYAVYSVLTDCLMEETVIWFCELCSVWGLYGCLGSIRCGMGLSIVEEFITGIQYIPWNMHMMFLCWFFLCFVVVILLIMCDLFPILFGLLHWCWLRYDCLSTNEITLKDRGKTENDKPQQNTICELIA